MNPPSSFEQRTRTHYDHHALQTTTPLERAKGPAAKLKTYHNTIKRLLLATFARNAPNLLDVACGRGGDLAKWDAAGVGHVLGLDLSPQEIHEAERRYARGKFRTRCDFRACSNLANSPWTVADASCDIVTCMFALQYFWASPSVIHHVCTNVSRVLKPGGMFMGTVPDGSRIRHIDTPAFSMRPLWSGPRASTGSAYICAIANTVTDGGGSLEYAVDEKTFVEIAAHYNLHPITRYEDVSLEACLENAGQADTVFKHFNPPYDGDFGGASRIFATFVFQKYG